jgi:hypothetical protein
MQQDPTPHQQAGSAQRCCKNAPYVLPTAKSIAAAAAAAKAHREPGSRKKARPCTQGSVAAVDVSEDESRFVVSSKRARKSDPNKLGQDESAQDAATAGKNDMYNGEQTAAPLHGKLRVESTPGKPADHADISQHNNQPTWPASIRPSTPCTASILLMLSHNWVAAIRHACFKWTTIECSMAAWPET